MHYMVLDDGINMAMPRNPLASIWVFVSVENDSEISRFYILICQKEDVLHLYSWGKWNSIDDETMHNYSCARRIIACVGIQ